jgi:hypothetical protein
MNDKYAENWEEYRRIRSCEIRAILSFIIAPFLLIPACCFIFGANIPHFISLVIYGTELVLFFCCAYYAVRLRAFPCPRCGNWFDGQFSMGSVREECQYCTLPKWANSDDNEEGILKDQEMRTMQ